MAIARTSKRQKQESEPQSPSYYSITILPSIFVTIVMTTSNTCLLLLLLRIRVHLLVVCERRAEESLWRVFMPGCVSAIAVMEFG